MGNLKILIIMIWLLRLWLDLWIIYLSSFEWGLERLCEKGIKLVELWTWVVGLWTKDSRSGGIVNLGDHFKTSIKLPYLLLVALAYMSEGAHYTIK